jgi:hypothetical protein
LLQEQYTFEEREVVIMMRCADACVYVYL